MGLAFTELRRFDEAIPAGKKALRQNLSLTAAYRCLASAFAHLGRDTEAREAAARVLETDPGFTISALTARGGQSNSKLDHLGSPKSGAARMSRAEIELGASLVRCMSPELALFGPDVSSRRCPFLGCRLNRSTQHRR
jgi:tetratricopeptide (TPR) repeat protein